MTAARIITQNRLNRQLKHTDSVPSPSQMISIRENTRKEMVKLMKKETIYKELYDMLHEALKEITDLEHVISQHIAEHKWVHKEIILEAMNLRNEYERFVGDIVNIKDHEALHILHKLYDEYEITLETLEKKREEFFIKHNFRSGNAVSAVDLS